MRNSGISLTDLNPAFVARNREIIAQELYGKKIPPVAAEPEAPKKRLRQSTKPVLNKLETRCRDTFVRPRHPGAPILEQAVRLELARGHWYKTDLFVPEKGQAIAYEVKGPKTFRGGFEALKVAARTHLWVKFILVWERKCRSDDWLFQEILP